MKILDILLIVMRTEIDLREGKDNMGIIKKVIEDFEEDDEEKS